jgi:hypothetical protein
VAGSGLARPRLRWLSLVLAVALAAAVAGPTTAVDPDIEGAYDTVWTSPPACNVPSAPAVVTVARIESRLVTFTLPDGTVYQGSIDADLNFDVTSKLSQWTGHFTLLSDGGATMAGEMIDPELSCGGVTLRVSITGKRTGTPGPSATPSASPDEFMQGFSGYLVAYEAFRTACDIALGQDRARACGSARKYRDTWRNAMEADLSALGEESGSETAVSLDHLSTLLWQAAEMGALQVPGPCGKDVFAFPIIHGMLPAFANLFIQGIVAAGQGRSADLDSAVTLADALLGYATTGDQKPPISSAPCSSPSA